LSRKVRTKTTQLGKAFNFKVPSGLIVTPRANVPYKVAVAPDVASPAPFGGSDRRYFANTLVAATCDSDGYFLLAALTTKPTDFLKGERRLRDPARNILSS
jgi:hypothetical protein